MIIITIIILLLMCPYDAILLGASVTGLGTAIDHVLEARFLDLHTAITRLRTIYSHDALIHPRFCDSISLRLLHTLQCTPCDGHPLLSTTTLSEGISTIVILTSAIFSGSTPAFNSGGQVGNQTCIFAGPFRLFWLLLWAHLDSKPIPLELPFRRR